MTAADALYERLRAEERAAYSAWKALPFEAGPAAELRAFVAWLEARGKLDGCREAMRAIIEDDDR